MGRLEFEVGGHKIVVDDIAPGDVHTVVDNLIRGFAARDTPTGPVIEHPKQKTIRDVYQVQSYSRPWTYWTVNHYGNGIMECGCPGYNHRGYCRHTTEALAKHRQLHGYRR